MTRIMLVERKVSDLKLGNMFVSWAIRGDEHYPQPVRVLNLKKSGDKIKVYLADMSVHIFLPEHVVIVQEFA